MENVTVLSSAKDSRREIRSLTHLLFYYFSFLWWEIIIRRYSVDRFWSFDFFRIAVFIVGPTLFVYIVIMFSPKPRRKNIGAFVFSLSSLLYMIQFVYFSVYKNFLTVSSVRGAGQVMEFWREILNAILRSSFYLILLALPVAAYMLIVRKNWSFENHLFSKTSIITVYLVIFLATFAMFYSAARDPSSEQSKIFGSGDLKTSVKSIGLVGSFQLDVVRAIFPPKAISALEETNIKDISEITELDYENPSVNDEYNVMNIDFAKLTENESDEAVKQLYNYFNGIAPTNKNEYTGMFKDYNLIFLTAEAFSSFAIDEELTPTLYKMATEGFKFNNFYNASWGVSTSDGEYVNCVGLIPKPGEWSMSKSSENYLPFALGNQLKELGYQTNAYHAHTFDFYRRDLSHPNLGYDYKGVGNGLEVKDTWPESDLEAMEKTMDEYISNAPFHAYYMTISGHLEYAFNGNSMATKNKSLVDHLDCSEPLKAYLACNIELDKAMEYALQRLEEEGLADKTLFVIAPDHYPYGLEKEQISEFLGHEVDPVFELYESSLIIYSPSMDEPVEVDKPCSSIDILPTVSNLMGLEYDSRTLMGRDIFSDAEALVMFENKSFITEKGKYDAAGDIFYPSDGKDEDREYINKILKVIDKKFVSSAQMLDHDFYEKAREDIDVAGG